MTRINSKYPVSKLIDVHLLAEHREIKRIPNLIKNGRYSLNDIPPNFTLGKGHVKFFYNKLLFLKNRYIELHNECLKRGFNVQNYEACWDNLPLDLMNDWDADDNSLILIEERLREKITNIKNKKITNKK